MDLKDKTALVTGGSLGIGRETARHLIARGARVAITGRNAARLEAAAEAMGAFPIAGDVARPEDVERTFAACLAQFGQLDVLVNNAGIGGDFAHLVDLTAADLERVFAVNVVGAALMAQQAARHFVAGRGGAIVNVGSTASLKGFARGSVYAASKFALRGLSQCWQAELRPHDVRVIHVNPSEVATAFGSDEGTEREAPPNKLRSEEIAHAIVAALEMDDRGFIPEFSVWATNPW